MNYKPLYVLKKKFKDITFEKSLTVFPKLRSSIKPDKNRKFLNNVSMACQKYFAKQEAK